MALFKSKELKEILEIEKELKEISKMNSNPEKYLLSKDARVTDVTLECKIKMANLPKHAKEGFKSKEYKEIIASLESIVEKLENLSSIQKEEHNKTLNEILKCVKEKNKGINVDTNLTLISIKDELYTQQEEELKNFENLIEGIKITLELVKLKERKEQNNKKNGQEWGDE